MSAVARWDPSRPAPATDDIVKCVACGLCLPHCPTFRLTGRETASPRGRIAAMRAVEEGHGEVDASFTTMMDECLACRACEAACPSGVPFGRMIEAARAQAEPTRRAAGRAGSSGSAWPRCCRAGAWCSAAGWLLALARALRLDRLAPPAQRAATPPASLREMLRPIPVVARLRARPPPCWPAASWTSPTGRRSARPCARSRRRATGPCAARPGGCCGALAMHYGQPEAARAMARERIPELEAGEIVVVNASGCSAHVRAYGELLADDPEWAERAERVAAKVARPDRAGAPRSATGRLGRVAVHDACHHLHAQRIEPRAMLAPRRRRVRRPRRRRPLLRRRGPLQRPPARARRAAAAPEGRRPSPRPARPWSPWPTPDARSRSPPAWREIGSTSASPTLPTWWRRLARPRPRLTPPRKMAVDLVIDIENSPGALAQVAAAISDAGVNIAAATCIGGGERAELHILVPHAEAARHLLAISHVAVTREREVVVIDVEDRPGVLADLTRAIARAGVNLDLVYVATREPRGLRGGRPPRAPRGARAQ